MPIRIRAFRPADADALATLFHESVRRLGVRHYTARQVAAWSPAKPDPGRYRTQAVGRTFLVAVDGDGAIAGYGDLEPSGHIDHLYVRPDAAGRGVGSALLGALEKAARSAGIPFLFVEASEGARRLFARRGFRMGARRAFVRRGVAIHNYRMSKALAGG